VFADVPFTKAKNAGDPSRDPNITIERRTVALLGYPCDMYAQGKLVKVQTVAVVVSAEKFGIPDDWAGAFTLAPLPDLHGDGQVHAVDLRTAANIDASYLVPANRTRSLTEYGWAVFRQRKALCDTRALVSIPALTAIGSATWAEIGFWQKWNEAGKQPADFQPWLDTPDAHLGGFTRRALLDRGMVDQASAALLRALS
jgi:hypothetical protein